MRALFLVLLVGCPGGDDTATFDCESIAITTADGAPDPCDVDACQACVDACGSDCMVLESYPPQYSCGSEGRWTVYDFCPDWSVGE